MKELDGIPMMQEHLKNCRNILDPSNLDIATGDQRRQAFSFLATLSDRAATMQTTEGFAVANQACSTVLEHFPEFPENDRNFVLGQIDPLRFQDDWDKFPACRELVGRSPELAEEALNNDAFRAQVHKTDELLADPETPLKTKQETLERLAVKYRKYKEPFCVGNEEYSRSSAGLNEAFDVISTHIRDVFPDDVERQKVLESMSDSDSGRSYHLGSRAEKELPKLREALMCEAIGKQHQAIEEVKKTRVKPTYEGKLDPGTKKVGDVFKASRALCEFTEARLIPYEGLNRFNEKLNGLMEESVGVARERLWATPIWAKTPERKLEHQVASLQEAFFSKAEVDSVEGSMPPTDPPRVKNTKALIEMMEKNPDESSQKEAARIKAWLSGPTTWEGVCCKSLEGPAKDSHGVAALKRTMEQLAAKQPFERPLGQEEPSRGLGRICKETVQRGFKCMKEFVRNSLPHALRGKNVEVEEP